MAGFLSSNGCISAFFHNILLKLSIHANLKCAFTPCYQNIKILKIDFYDVNTNELYFWLMI